MTYSTHQMEVSYDNMVTMLDISIIFEWKLFQKDWKSFMKP